MLLSRSRCGRRSSRSWRSWSSTRRRSMSGRTPSMTLTMTPTTRPSSSTRTTSFDLRSARRHRGRWGPLPVWPQLFGGRCGEAGDGLAHRQPMAEAKRTPPGCAHCAERLRDRSTKSRCDRIRPPIPIPPGQAVIVALRQAQRPVWAPGVRILGRPPIIRRRSRTSSIVGLAHRSRSRTCPLSRADRGAQGPRGSR